MDDDVEKRRLVTENSILRSGIPVRTSKLLPEGTLVVMSDDPETARVMRNARELAEIHRRFYRIDVLEEAARAVCRVCRGDDFRAKWVFDPGGHRLLEPGSHRMHTIGTLVACDAWPIRSLQLEEWR